MWFARRLRLACRAADASASHILGAVEIAVEQQLRVHRHVGATRVLRIEQRLPAFARQVAVAHARPTVLGVGARELVDPLIAGVARMPLDPLEAHRAFACAQFRVDRLDHRRVLHRLFLRVLPAVLLPPVHPFGGAVDRVLRVGFDDERLAARVRAQRHQHRAQFTDLVRAVRRAAGVAIAGVRVLALARVVGPCPAHRPVGIAEGGSISGNSDRHALHCTARHCPHQRQRPDTRRGWPGLGVASVRCTAVPCGVDHSPRALSTTCVASSSTESSVSGETNDSA